MVCRQVLGRWRRLSRTNELLDYLSYHRALLVINININIKMNSGDDSLMMEDA